MNERIKELALEARIAYYSKNGAYEGSDEGLSVIPSTQSLEKFAELIVRECTNMVEEHQPRYLTRRQAQEMADTIREHFGVEE